MFPNAPAVVVDTGAGSLDSYIQRRLVRDYPSGQIYLDANLLARAVIRAGLSVSVKGWINPQLQVNGANIQLGTALQPVDAASLLGLALEPLAAQLGLRDLASVPGLQTPLASTHTLRLAGPVPLEEVYALVSVMWLPSNLGPDHAAPTLAFGLARPSADGRLTFDLPYDLFYVQLSGDLTDLKRDAARLLDPAARPAYASARQPAHAVLLKLSGQLAPQDMPCTLVPRSGLSVGR